MFVKLIMQLTGFECNRFCMIILDHTQVCDTAKIEYLARVKDQNNSQKEYCIACKWFWYNAQNMFAQKISTTPVPSPDKLQVIFVCSVG